MQPESMSFSLQLRRLTLDEEPLGNFELFTFPAEASHREELYYQASIVATISTQGEVKIIPSREPSLEAEIACSYRYLIEKIQRMASHFEPVNIVLHADPTGSLENRLRFARQYARQTPFLPELREINGNQTEKSQAYGFRGVNNEIHMSLDLFTRNPYAGDIWQDIAAHVLLSLFSEKSRDKLKENSQALFKSYSFSPRDFYNTHPEATTHLLLLEVVPALLSVFRQQYELEIVRKENRTKHVVNNIAFDVLKFGEDNLQTFLDDWAPLLFPHEFNLYFRDFITLGNCTHTVPVEQLEIALYNWAIFANTPTYQDLLPILDSAGYRIASLIQNVSVPHEELIANLYQGAASVDNPRIVFIQVSKPICANMQQFCSLLCKLVEVLPTGSLVVSDYGFPSGFNIEDFPGIQWMDFHAKEIVSMSLKLLTTIDLDDYVNGGDNTSLEAFKSILKARVKQDKHTHILIICYSSHPYTNWGERDNPSRNDKNPFHQVLQQLSGNNARFALQIELPNESSSLNEAYLAKKFRAIRAPLPEDVAIMPIHTWPGCVSVFGNNSDGIFVTSADRGDSDYEKTTTIKPKSSNWKPSPEFVLK